MVVIQKNLLLLHVFTRKCHERAYLNINLVVHHILIAHEAFLSPHQVPHPTLHSSVPPSATESTSLHAQHPAGRVQISSHLVCSPSRVSRGEQGPNRIDSRQSLLKERNPEQLIC